MTALAPHIQAHIKKVFQSIIEKDSDAYFKLFIDQEWIKDIAPQSLSFKKYKSEAESAFEMLIDELEDIDMYSSETKINEINIEKSATKGNFAFRSYSIIVGTNSYQVEISGVCIENKLLKECRDEGKLSRIVLSNTQHIENITPKGHENYGDAIARYTEHSESESEPHPISTQEEISATESKLNITLPAALKNIYLNYGNGFGESYYEEFKIFPHQEIIGIIDFLQEQANEGAAYDVFTTTRLGKHALTQEETQLVRDLNNSVFIFAINGFDDQNLDLILFDTNGNFSGISYDHHEEYDFFEDYLKTLISDLKWHSDFEGFFSKLCTSFLLEFDEDYDYEKEAQKELFFK